MINAKTVEVVAKAVVTAAGAAGAAVAVVKPIVVEVRAARAARIAALVKIPTVYSKSKSIVNSLEQAVAMLDEKKLSPKPTPILTPHIKYKDCFDSQAMGTEPKGGQMVDPDTIVYVKYLPADTIEKSQALFDQGEAKKADTILQKQTKKEAQKERHQQILADAKDRLSVKRDKKEPLDL